ncbi:iron-sulfur cluster repair di-iron protein [bacterium]|nr:iron-sulfur cluster repair di-iron protein [bacterium]QQR56775.1 MAG: iron-sulfur cluster repair di-iron protein [Candidatus Melainabacteria bacterium]
MNIAKEPSQAENNHDLSNQSLGSLVAQKPLRAAVFDEFGLDFCCGGKQSLNEACIKNGVDLTLVLQRLLENEQTTVIEKNWIDATLNELIDNIESTHHQYLKTELPRLYILAEKVARVHGEKAPEMVTVAKVFIEFKEELEQHTAKEEMVLFPYIRKMEKKKFFASPPFGTVANPIRCMELEHENAAHMLQKMRKLTNEYSPPEHACGSWKALLGGLAQLDIDLRIHIHKENSILFPEAIQLEKDSTK